MAFNTVLLNKNDLDKLLKDLADALQDDDFLEFGVCGGGALMYFYEIDYQTTDFDVFNISYGYGSLTTRILRAISTVGDNNDVGHDWLNDAVSLPDFQDKDILNVRDMIPFLDLEKKVWIYDSKGDPKISLTPVSFCGIIAAKLIAGRAKDIETVANIFRTQKIHNEKDLEKLFYNYSTFLYTEKYEIMLESARIVFERNGDL